MWASAPAGRIIRLEKRDLKRDIKEQKRPTNLQPLMWASAPAGQT
jgi:hypothetical protein